MKKRFLAVLFAVVMILNCAPGEMGNQFEVHANTKLSNPKIVKNTAMPSKKKITYDCVWFGSYPQTEILAKEDDEDYYSGKAELGYEVNASLYAVLQEETGWSSNERTVDGIKYRRFKMGEEPYHYFRYDKIKWRVLKVSDNKAFLLAENVLDRMPYSSNSEYPTWETSLIRAWLNGYGKEKNGRDFLHSAFSPEEQKAILTSTVVNNTVDRVGVCGGNNTRDKLFLLSTLEMDSFSLKKYGFEGDYNEISRFQSSAYVRAMSSDDEDSLDSYWLRTPGCQYDGHVAYYAYGDIGGYSDSGGYVDDVFGIRPALNLNLASGLWTYAGTVSSAEFKTRTIKEVKITGLSHKIAAGKKIQLSVKVAPAGIKADRITWSSSNSDIAAVTQDGTVSIKKGTGGKTVKITVDVVYEGYKKSGVWKIEIMKGAVKSIKIKGAKKTLKVGKKLKLKAVVKTTKGKSVNKKIEWSSSKPEYASVSSTGVVKAKKAGKGKKVKITARATDGTGKKKTVTIKIK